jgi:predicted RNase H-like HicB family nuclease
MTTDLTVPADDYLILVEGGPPTNFSAWSPDLPGCAGVGPTVEECVADMREAIRLHLSALATSGEQLPQPTGPGIYIERPPRARRLSHFG